MTASISDAVGGAVEVLHAAYLDNVGACTEDIRAHAVEAVGEVDNVRLLRCVFDYCEAVSLDRRHDGVDGGSDSVLVKEDLGSDQLIGAEIHHSAVDLVLSAERRETLEVLVDGTVAEIAAAGHGYVSAVEAPEQSPEEIGGGSHELRLLVGNRNILKLTRVDLDSCLVQHAYFCAHLGHYL